MPLSPDLALQIFLAGFNEGFNRALSAHGQLASLVAARSDAPPQAHTARPARRDAPPAENKEPSPLPAATVETPKASQGRSPSGLANGATRPPVRRRGLRPSEQRVLDFITSHPGCTGNEIRAACKSLAAAYSLARRRKVRRVEDPKPHTNGPWVRFYPMEPTDAQA